MSVAAAVVFDIDGQGIQALTRDKGDVRYNTRAVRCIGEMTTRVTAGEPGSQPPR